MGFVSRSLKKCDGETLLMIAFRRLRDFCLVSPFVWGPTVWNLDLDFHFCPCKKAEIRLLKRTVWHKGPLMNRKTVVAVHTSLQ